MKTPRTDAAIDAANKMAGVTFQTERERHYVKVMRQLETDVQELREALEMLNNEFKQLPHSLGYRYTHTEKVDAILAKTGAQ